MSARDTRWWWIALAVVGLATGLTLVGWSANPLLRVAGGLLAMCAGFVQQHATRRATEQRQRDREALIGIVVANSIDAIMTVDSHGAVASFNPAAERMFGWPSAEIIGQSVNRLFASEPVGEEPERARGGHPATRASPVGKGTREVLAERRGGAPFPIYLACTESQMHGQGFVTAIARDLTQYRQNAEALQRANALLQTKVVESEERNRVIALLGQMSGLLQAAVNSADAYASIGDFARQLFPHDAGALCTMEPARNSVEVVASWGEPSTLSVFAPEECWALRSGRVHVASGHDTGALCPHLSSSAAAGHACMPLTAQGESLGLVTFRWHPEDGAAKDPAGAVFRVKLAAAFAEQVGLALTNLHLKQMLRVQAIHDPLTGLHNRRFLEEAFHRELLRAARRKSPVGVLMLDLDHFKEFTDAHGHAAGDSLLRAFAVQLRSDIRAEDIACRYGGEEFAVLLPDATLGQALTRAEQIREGVRKIVVDFQGKRLAGVTVSIGVAGLPEHGLSPDALLRAADAALYVAKAEGRDRTTLAVQILKSAAVAPPTVSAPDRRRLRPKVGS
ncbi:MAG: diguanylate cyclase [Deltaproteobacteria bacterium]|nr:diguanylate cyclase [Deltaproteobacteria bacterium]